MEQSINIGAERVRAKYYYWSGEGWSKSIIIGVERVGANDRLCSGEN